MKITATQGMIYRRIHDGFEMGNEIWLGVDYSTGVPREDKAEYYEEIETPEIPDEETSDSEALNIILGK